MAKAFIDDTTLTNIGNAIRSVNGSSDLMLPSAMPDVIKTLGNGLHVWKKYNVEFVQGTATTVTLQNDGTFINLYTIDNLYLKDDLTVGIQGDVAKTVAISSLLEGTVLGGVNPIYYAYGEDGFVYAYSRCSSDGTAITISNPVTAGKGEFINYIVSDNPNAFPDGGWSEGAYYDLLSNPVDCSGATATASEILKGYTAGTADGVVTGTLKKLTEASGTYTPSSNDSSVIIEHGLGAVPTGYGITCASVKGQSGGSITVTADATKLNLSAKAFIGSLGFSPNSEINWFAYLYK